jgi:hypothetical protein
LLCIYIAIRELTGPDTVLHLADDTGMPIVAQIKIKLSLVSEPAPGFMDGVDADVAHLDGVLVGTSAHVDNAVSIVKLMDSIADVSCSYTMFDICQ